MHCAFKAGDMAAEFGCGSLFEDVAAAVVVFGVTISFVDVLVADDDAAVSLRVGLRLVSLVVACFC